MHRAAAFIAMAAFLVVAVIPAAPSVAKSGAAPAVAFARADLTAGTANGAAYDGSAVVLATPSATGVYTDPFGYGDVPFESGTWTSAWRAVPFGIDELVASWQAATPAGTWIRVETTLRGSGRTTKRYTLQVWASGDTDIHRTSVPAQGDGDGFVAIDTFVRSKKAAPLDEYQLVVTLYRRAGTTATPAVRMLGAMVSATSPYAESTWSGTAADLEVPRLSQETHMGHYPEYDGGGEAWCSPTSTAMVLRYWGRVPDTTAFPGADHADGDVDHAARYVYDWNYQGAGNWPNNTAYAARFGLDAFVTRLRSLDEAKRFIDAGIPLVASINGKLPGFLFDKTNGHLLVIRGFTAAGDVITNDPAVWTNDEARKVYARADFESVWLGGSQGIVYVIRDPAVPLPANVPGLPANW